MDPEFEGTDETAKSRGRPRDFDPGVVLEAALDLFWRQGFRQTTTRELVQATGLSQSSIYNTFGSKSGLLDAALAHYENETNVRLLAPLEASTDGLGGIQRFFADLTDWVGRNERRGCMLINMMAEDGGSTPAVSERVRGYRVRVRTAFETALLRAKRLREVASPTDGGRADLLVGLVMGLDIAARGGSSSRELRELLSAIHAQIDAWRVGPDTRGTHTFLT